MLKKIASEGLECLKRLKGAKKKGQVLKNNNKENIRDHDMKLSHGKAFVTFNSIVCSLYNCNSLQDFCH